MCSSLEGGALFLPLESAGLHTGGKEGLLRGLSGEGETMPHLSELVCSWGSGPTKENTKVPPRWEAPESSSFFQQVTFGGGRLALSLWTGSLFFWSLSPETGPGNPQRNPVSGAR